MDTTKQNILMCEKAVEIQKLWEATNGDWFIAECTVWNIGNSVLSEIKEPLATMVQKKQIGMTLSGSMIWLPSQDQLQGIYLDNRKHKLNCGQMSMFFEEWRQNELMRYGKDLINWSMEQLWLAFVMKERWNKTWTGEDWK